MKSEMKLNKQTLHQGEDKRLRKQHPLRGVGKGLEAWGCLGHRGQTGWGRREPALEVHGLSEGHELD